MRRVLAPNPGAFTGPGTNTWILGDGPARIVIDPGPDLASHRAAINRGLGGAALGAILVTHAHADHLEAAEDLAREHRCRVIRHPELADGDDVHVGELTLGAVFTPGHAPDHLCFWMAGDRVLFCGDLILGRGSSVIAWPQGDVADYMRSLERVRELGPRMLFPGHFDPVADAGAKIAEYLSHRLQREAQVLAALGAEPLALERICEIVYGPELASPAATALLGPARASVRAHLEKLAQEGRARSLDEGAEPGWVRSA